MAEFSRQRVGRLETQRIGLDTMLQVQVGCVRFNSDIV